MARNKRTKADDALAKTLGQRLKTVREARGRSVYWLADVAGASLSGLTKIEAGASLPGASLLLRVADALETSADYLLGRSDSPQK